MTTQHQFSGVPVPTRGQQTAWNTAHRFDIPGPFSITATGDVTWASGLPFRLPGGCILLEIFAGSEDAGSITVEVGAETWGPILMPGGTPGILGLGRYPGASDLALALLDPVVPSVSATDVDLALLWFHIIRWGGTP